MSTPIRTALPEIYMKVIDPRRIKSLMVVQEVSARTLATECGWRSHSYVTRILRGEITTVTPDRAARMARFFRVPIDSLFVPRLSTDTGRSAKREDVA